MIIWKKDNAKNNKNRPDSTRDKMIKLLTVSRRFRTYGLIFLDILIISVAICLAILLNYQQGQFYEYHWFELSAILIMALSAKLPIFILMGMYRVSLTHFDLDDMTDIFKAVTIGSLLFGGMAALSWEVVTVSLPTIIIDYFFTLILIGGLRASKRVYLHLTRQRHSSSTRRVLIIGAGSAGELTLRAIFQEPDTEIMPVGMVDDDLSKQEMTIHGIPILGKCNDIPRLVKEFEIQELLIAIPSAPPAVLKKIVKLGSTAGLKNIRVLPSLNHIINGKVALSDLRDIHVEDLLGREPVQIDTKEIDNYLRNKVVLVTGAAGSIGSELCRQIASFAPDNLIVLDQDETALFHLREELERQFPASKLSMVVGDIQDRARIYNIFKRYQPQVVYHSAAYKHVRIMEENPEEAIRNNVLGTKTVGEAARFYNAKKFVLISTDKAVNPTSIMGATKRLAEIVIQSLDQENSCRFTAVRFGNVLGSRGSVVPIFKEQIERGGPITITHPDMRRYFMTPSEAALLVLQAGAIGNGGEILVLDMGEPVAIQDLAREMIHLAGLEPDKDIPIVFTNPFPGEKLFEDILTAEEGTSATKYNRIYTAKSNNIVDMDRLTNSLDELQELINQDNTTALIKILRGLVPSYCSNNGVYNHEQKGRSPEISVVSDDR